MKPSRHDVTQRSERCRGKLVAAVFVLLALPLVGWSADSPIVAHGKGSFTTRRPETIEAPPSRVFKTDDIKRAIPTNQWWSSLAWEQFSSNMFPHPLGMVCTEAGLAVSNPGAGIDSASGHIMGGGVSSNGDIVIGLSDTESFASALLADYSSWFVTAEFVGDSSRLRTSFGHGSPFVFCRHTGGEPRLRFAEKPVIWSATKAGNTMGITVRGSHYGLFGAEGSRWSGTNGVEFTNDNANDYFSIALLPDREPETLELFSNYAHNHVVDSSVIFASADGHIEATYRFVTKAMEGAKAGTIFAMYPHHWKYSDVPLNGMTYRSVRGTMKVAVGEGFQTVIPVQGVLPMLPGQGVTDRERLVRYLEDELANIETEYGDTYWEGKHLGKLATLSGIAEVVGETELRQQFVGEIRRRLENWFTASPNEASPLFYYEPNWGSLIGAKPSYGSDAQLNDHHFHYGYFIRAAAEVARLDPAWANDWGPMVELLIRDIASTDHSDPMFPSIRCFDLYAGHSWASGHAKFADGNNQESSSESMNAWYAMMLWGEATGNHKLRDTGMFLYNTERTAVEEYWFDVSGTNFPANFSNVALGMIWGGKGAFSTWFSGDIDCIHGINWLPFTPASIYMGRHPDYVKKNHERIVEQRPGGSDYNNGWGDLVVMFGALSNPKSAADYIDSTPNCKVESGNTHAFMYHWIHTLDRLGINDASVTADYPFVNVYLKDGQRTYAVYNFHKAPLTVRFSDDTIVVAAPHGLTVEQNVATNPVATE